MLVGLPDYLHLRSASAEHCENWQLLRVSEEVCPLSVTTSASSTVSSSAFVSSTRSATASIVADFAGLHCFVVCTFVEMEQIDGVVIDVDLPVFVIDAKSIAGAFAHTMVDVRFLAFERHFVG